MRANRHRRVGRHEGRQAKHARLAPGTRPAPSSLIGGPGARSESNSGGTMSDRKQSHWWSLDLSVIEPTAGHKFTTAELV